MEEQRAENIDRMQEWNKILEEYNKTPQHLRKKIWDDFSNTWLYPPKEEVGNQPNIFGSARTITVDGVVHSDFQNLSTYAKEMVHHKDLMTIIPLNGSNDILRGDCTNESVVDKHRSISMIGRQEGKFIGTGSNCDLSSGPHKAIMCNEISSEISFEGEYEEEIHSSSRELSDNSEFPTNVKTNTSGTLALCDYTEIAFEIDCKCDGD